MTDRENLSAALHIDPGTAARSPHAVPPLPARIVRNVSFASVSAMRSCGRPGPTMQGDAGRKAGGVDGDVAEIVDLTALRHAEEALCHEKALSTSVVQSVCRQ